MDTKLPYYMAYPMPLLYDDERIDRRDFEYMKSLYPATAKRVLPYIEDECDRMEYDCSMIYDEYPDQLQLNMMGKRIYDKAKEKEKEPGEWLRDLIQVMLYQELYKRRSDRRKYSQKYFPGAKIPR
jgi:hypothetical protein